MSIGTCKAQEYDDEYRPEPRSFNVSPNRFQFESISSKSTTTEAPVAILKQINRHNEGKNAKNEFLIKYKEKKIPIRWKLYLWL